MHKHFGLAVLVIFIGALFVLPGASDKLFALFFIGLVPYTHYTLPAETMLAIYSLLLVGGLFAIIHQISTATNAVKRDIKSRERARKKVLHEAAKTQPKTQKPQAKKHYLPAIES